MLPVLMKLLRWIVILFKWQTIILAFEAEAEDSAWGTEDTPHRERLEFTENGETYL